MNYLFGTGLNNGPITPYSVMGLPNNGNISVFTAINNFEPSAVTVGTNIENNNCASIAVDTSGNIWVVGDNTSGFLGLGTVAGTNTWTKVTGITGVPNVSGKTIAATYGSMFVIGNDGKLYVCGKNGADTLGNNLGLGTTNSVTTFTAVFTSETVEQVVCSYAATMIMTTSKKIFVTGSNSAGQMNRPVSTLGYQTFTNITSSFNVPLSGNTIKGIAAGIAGTFFLIDNFDYVYSWGSNNFKLLGRDIGANTFDWNIGLVVINSKGQTRPFSSFKSLGASAIGIGGDGHAYLWGLYDGINAYSFPTFMPVPLPGDATTKVKNVWTWGSNYVIQAFNGNTYLAGLTGYGQSNFNTTDGFFNKLSYLSGYDNSLFFGGGSNNTYMISANAGPVSTTTSWAPPGTTTTTTTTPCPGYPCSDAIKITPLNTDLSRPYCPTTVGASYGNAMYFYFAPDHTDSYIVTFKAPAGQAVSVSLYVGIACIGNPIQTWTTNVKKDTFFKGAQYTFKVVLAPSPSPPPVIVNYSIYYTTTTTTTPCPGGNCFQAPTYKIGSDGTKTYEFPACAQDPFWITLYVPYFSNEYKLYCAPSTGKTIIYAYNNYEPPTTCGKLLNGDDPLRPDPTFYLDPINAKPTIVSLQTATFQKYVLHIVREPSAATAKNFKFLIQAPVTTSTTSTTTSAPAYWSVCDPCLTGGFSKCKLIPGGASVCEYASAEGPFNTLDDCVNFSTPVACPNNFGCGPNCC